MKHLKPYKLFEEDAYHAAMTSGNKTAVYRNTALKWLMEFLNKGTAVPYGDKKRFISFSNKEDSGGADNFGDVRIEFNSKLLYKQGAIEIEYDRDFFEEHPDICTYVTGYKGEEDYYKQNDYEGKEDFEENGQDDQDTLTWETMIEDYENEAEIVIKKLKYIEGLITKVILPKKISKKDIAAIEKKGIQVETE
jgi:hypothetical protein